MTADAGLGVRLGRWLRGGKTAAECRALADDAIMLLEDRIMLDAEATVSIDGPATTALGSAFAITLTFDNTADGDAGSNVGYAPYIDLYLPTSGRDGGSANDGILFGSATYLGAPVQATLLTFDASGIATHPFARDSSGALRTVTGAPGDTLVVLSQPFGSFTPEQTPAVVTVNLTLSPLADYDVAHSADQLTIKAQGGFALGRDPLDNPTADPPVLQTPPVSFVVTPSVVTLTKVSNAPEGETATGPNFERLYTINLDLAVGQTLSDVQVQDLLPRNIVFLGSTVTVGTGTLLDQPTIGATVDPLNNRLLYDFGNLVGVAGPDAQIVVRFYVADVQGGSGGSDVIDPVTGAPSLTENDVSASGIFKPLDPRDPLTPIIEDATPVDNVIVNRSVAVQKSSSLIDNNTPGLSAGDGVIYRLRVQLSDYFTLGDIMLTDLLSDGQRIDTSFLPVFSVSERGAETGALAFSGLSVVAGEFAGGAFSTAYDALTGTTAVNVALSQELVARGLLGGDGILAGGRTQPGDTAAGTQATSIIITFRAIVQTQFAVGGSAVGQGDTISDTVSVTGTVRDNGSLLPTGGTPTDSSDLDLVVPVGAISSKAVVAVNGAAPEIVNGSPILSPGDLITFRLRYELPVSSFDNLKLVDFLPLPILPATGLVQSADAPGVLPGEGQWNYGVNDTLSTLPGAPDPTISFDGSGNSVSFSYGTYSLQLQPVKPAPTASTIEILFTMRVADLAFGDGLLLTNLVSATERGSQGTLLTTNALAQFTISQPELVISKGVVDYLGNNSVSFEGSRAPPGVSFAGAVGSLAPAVFTGSITDTALTAGAIDANLKGIDAGDKLTFAIVINNNGTGRDGAFNVRFSETLPAGFGIPGDGPGLNLKVTTGAGAPVAFTSIAGGLFGGGIELVDGPSDGAIAPDLDGDQATGSSTDDIIVITYDLVALQSVQPRQTWTNAATLFNYAARPGGTDFSTVDLVDTAQVTTRDPQLAKAVVATSETFTSGSNLAIGETVTFRITYTLPEGQLNNTVLSDSLPATGSLILKPLSATVVSVGSGISGPGVPVPGAGGVLAGQVFSFNLGAVSVMADNSAANDTIVIEVVALAVDDARNTAGDRPTNTGRIAWTTTLETGATVNNSLTDTATTRIVVPDLNLVKSVSPILADANDVVTYRLVVTNPSGTNAAPAFNVNVIDTDLASLGFNEVTIRTVTSAGAVGAAATADAAGVVRITADSLATSGTITVTFTARVSEFVIAGTTLTNFARITEYATLPRGAPDARVITTEPLVSAALTIGSVGLTKTLVSTSIDLDANPRVQIGETATFDIVGTLPEGVVESLILTDQLPFSGSALQFVSMQLVSIGGNITGSLVSVGDNAVIAGDGKSASFTFGTLTNRPDDLVNALDRIVIRVTVVVPDVAENSAADNAVVNTAIAQTPQGSRSATSALDIVEPRLTIVKSGSPGLVDAGTIIDYGFVIANSGDGIAYDVLLIDPLEPNVALVAGSIRYSGVISGTAASFADIPLDALRPGQSLSVSYQGLVLDSAVLGTTAQNTAKVSWDSLPGDAQVGRVPDPLPASTVAIPIGGPVSIDKTVLTTSVGDDADPNVLVGEVVTFQLTAVLPDGTTSLSFRDTLPPGFVYVAGSGAFVSAFGNSSPPAGFDVSAVGPVVTFSFGTVVNPGVASPDNRVVVTLQALVSDSPINQRGSVLINTVSATSNLGTVADPTPPAVTIIAPDLVVDKAALVNGGTVGEAGDIVTYSLSITHSGASNAAASDFVVTDTLPVGLTLLGPPIVTGSGAAGAVVDPAPPANGIRVTGGSLALGETIIITYQARIDDANLLPSVLENTATLAWDSLPGVGGRTDEGSDTAGITVTGPQLFTKEIVATSDPLTGTGQFDPAVTDLVVGEEIRIELVATLPEGSLSSVVIIDNLLTGFGTLDFVAGSVTATVGDVDFAIIPLIADTNGDGVGDRLTFDFGAVTLPGDNDPTNNFVTIRYSAVVPDLPVNFAGDNRLQFQPASLETPLGKRAAQVVTEIVEPKLVLDKTSSAITGTSGDIITYRLTLSHAGESTAAARDINLVDDLSAGNLTLVPGSLVVISGPGSVIGPNVTVSVPTLALGEETIIEYRAIVGVVPPGSGVPNIADADFDSYAGPGGRPGTATDTFTFGVPNLDKVITGTSQADTGTEQFRPTLNDLAIGERITYDLLVTLPEGTTNVIVTDRLLALGNLGLLQLVGTPFITLGAGVTATNPNPVAVETDTNGDGIADLLSWNFGAVTYAPGGTNSITISVETVVPDRPEGGPDAGNSSGDLLILPANLDYGFGNTIDVIAVDLVEPRLGLEKLVSPVFGEAGVLVGYVVTIRNLGEGPAYDLDVLDVAAVGLVPEGGATLSVGGVETVFADANAVVVARLLPGEVATVSYAARIADTVLVGSVLPNMASTPYDSLPGADAGQRIYAPVSDDAVVTLQATTPAALVKAIPVLTTSDANTGDVQVRAGVTDLGIGETAQVVLTATLPRGTVTEVVLSDRLTVANAKLGIDVASVRVTLGGTVLDPASYTVGTVDEDGDGLADRVDVRFASLTVPGAVDPADYPLVLSYTATALDIAANAGGDTLDLPATLAFTTADGPATRATATASADIVEPELTLAKSVVPVVGDAGDVIGYTLAISNRGSGPVYDLALDDVLPANLAFVGGVTVTGAISTSAASLALLDLPLLLPGESIVISYSAVVGDGAASGDVLVNSASLSGRTLDDAAGRLLPLITDSASVTVTGGVTLAKAIPVVGTSLADTTDARIRAGISDLAIGERATVLLDIVLPEGTTRELVLTDRLTSADGRLVFVAGSVTATLGGVAVPVTVTPVDEDGDGLADRVVLDFGTVVNPGDNDPANNVIRISYQAVAADLAGNASGDQLDLGARLAFVTGSGPGAAVAAASADLVEPRLGLEKVVSPVFGEAGVLVGYVVTIRNLGEGPAYDLDVLDVAAVGLVPEGGATLSVGGVETVFADANAVVVARLLPGEVATVSYAARIADTVLVGSVLPNMASTPYDSLPGADAGQRIYAPVSDDAVVTLQATTPAALVKAIPVLTTSDANTGDVQVRAGVTDLGIGETAQVVLTATLPRGTVTEVVLSDRLTVANAKLGIDVASVRVTLGGTVLDPASYTVGTVDEDGDGLADRVDVRFASLTVPGAVDPADYPLVLSYTATALDIAANAGGDTLDLPATLAFTTADGPATRATATASADIVEPELTLAKSVVPVVGDAGDVIGYTLAISNRGSGPVYDLALDDVLPANLAFVGGVTVTGAISTSAASLALLDLPLLLPGESIVISYSAVVGDGAASGDVLVNSASLSGRTLDDAAGRLLPLITDSASVTVTGGVTLAKAIPVVGTSLADTTDARIRAGISDLAIGERATVLLDIVLPEGTTRELVLTDRLTSADGRLVFVAGSVTATLGGVAVPVTVTPVDEDGDGLADRVVLDFGTVVNPGDNDPANNVIRISYQAVAADLAGNASGDQLDLGARLAFVTGSGPGAAVAAASADLVEPRLGLEKVVSPVFGEAGVLVGYVVTIRNLGEGPAYDLDVLDVAAVGLVPEGGATLSVGGVETVFADANAVVVARLLPGEVATVSYAARIADTVLVGSVLPNMASTPYDSLPGADAGQRIYAPVSDDAVVTLQATTPAALVKAIPVLTTSDANTGDVQVRAGVTDLGIGETAQVVLTATLPRGTVTEVVLSDRLTVANAKLGIDVASVRVTLGGTVLDPASYTVGTVDEDGDGLADRVDVRFASLTVPGAVDPADYPLVLSYTATALDIAANAGGDTLDLPATLAFTTADGPATRATATASADIVEPELTLAKSVVPVVGDAGDVIGYTLAISNRGSGPVYDLALDDVLPANLAFVGGVTVTGAISTSAASLALLDLPLLLPGESIVISYSAVVGDGAASGDVLVNSASLSGRTLDDAAGRLLPLITDSASVTVTGGVTLAKAIPVVGTSLADTTDARIRAGISDLAIGERATVLLDIVLPEGTTRELVLTDRLTSADGRLVFVAGSVTATLGGVAVPVTVTPVDEDGDGLADRVVLDFGTVVNPGDNDPANNVIRISYQAVAADLAGNASGDQLDLGARLAFVTGSGPGAAVAAASADLVEPRLGLEKVVSPVFGEAGVLVGYVVTIRNLGEGPAYDLDVLDVAAVGLVPEGGATLSVGGVETVFADANAVVVARLLPGEVATVSYAARIADTVLVGSVLPNMASTPYDSLPGADAGQRIYAPVSDDAVVTLQATTPAALVKAIPVLTTSDANTGDVQVRAGVTDLGIGETAQVVLTATLPRGTVTEVVLSDRLTVANAKLGIDVASVRVTLGGTVLDPASYTVGTVDEDGDGLADRVDVRFASLTVPGSVDPADYPLVIRYTATALDIAPNAGGDLLDLPASLRFTTAVDHDIRAISSASVDLVEPDLTLAKTVVKTEGDRGSLNGLLPPAGALAGTGGDIFTYTLRIGQGALSTGPAYDLALSDILPAGLAIIDGSIISSFPGATIVASANSLTVTAPTLLPGEGITISYQARILDATLYDTVLPNRVGFGFDTQAGPGGRADSLTADASIQLAGNGTVVKTIIATSNPNSGSGAFDPDVVDLTIGEEVTYRVVATLAEGTTARVVITDKLPSGAVGVLELLSTTRPVLGANVRAEIPDPVATLTDTDGDGLVDTIRFDFGRVTVLGDNIIDARDTISFEVVARALDDPRNSSGDRLDASVVLDFGTGTDSDRVPANIVEPTLIVSKVALTPDRFLGQIASYEISVRHDPNSVVAADITVIDTLSPGLILVPGSFVIVSSPPGVPVSISGTTVSLPVLPLGTELVIRFDAQISYDVDVTKPLFNTATVNYDQVPGAGGRPTVTEDTAVINLLPAQGARRETELPDFMAVRYVEQLPQVDAIYSGTGQAGSRLMLSLVDASGAPAGTAAVTTDAGGNWIALVPRATMADRHDRPDALSDSRLFADMADRATTEQDWNRDRSVSVGAFVADAPHRVDVDAMAAGLVLPDDVLGQKGGAALHTYFAPAWRDELFVNQPLSIEQAFRNLAGTAVARDFASDKTPAGFGANGFNADLLPAGVGEGR